MVITYCPHVLKNICSASNWLWVILIILFISVHEKVTRHIVIVTPERICGGFIGFTSIGPSVRPSSRPFVDKVPLQLFFSELCSFKFVWDMLKQFGTVRLYCQLRINKYLKYPDYSQYFFYLCYYTIYYGLFQIILYLYYSIDFFLIKLYLSNKPTYECRCSVPAKWIFTLIFVQDISHLLSKSVYFDTHQLSYLFDN